MSADLTLAYEHCRQLARESGSNFYLAFFGLPRDKFLDMCVLYAYLRRTDDLADAPGRSLTTRQLQVRAWRDQVAAVLAGAATEDPVLRATRDLARRRGIPEADLLEVINGVESDLIPRRFQSFDQLEHYCYQVAGVVGLCCVRIWGVARGDERTSALACGTAFQLTNILRDFGEDAEQGRVYLPTEDLERFHYRPEDLQQRRRNQAFAALMEFEAQRTWSYYQQALPLFDMLTPEGQRIFASFWNLYSSLLRELERRQFDVFQRRVRIPAATRLRIGVGSWLKLPPRRPICPTGRPTPVG